MYYAQSFAFIILGTSQNYEMSLILYILQRKKFRVERGRVIGLRSPIY